MEWRNQRKHITVDLSDRKLVRKMTHNEFVIRQKVITEFLILHVRDIGKGSQYYNDAHTLIFPYC